MHEVNIGRRLSFDLNCFAFRQGMNLPVIFRLIVRQVVKGSHLDCDDSFSRARKLA